jgi:soluble lytic murein transglycosylase-like protein
MNQFVMDRAVDIAVAPQSRRGSRRNGPHAGADIQKSGDHMVRKICLGTLLIAIAASASPVAAQDQNVARLDANGNLNSLIARHASANNVPEALLRRVIKRESGGNPRAVSQGNYGLMQIRLGTARAMGYRGTAAGLLDADTNMTYAVKYLAGAYHAANGNPDRAVHYYAAGYYYADKRKGMLNGTDAQALNAFASASASASADGGSDSAAVSTSDPVTPAEKIRQQATP